MSESFRHTSYNALQNQDRTSDNNFELHPDL